MGLKNHKIVIKKLLPMYIFTIIVPSIQNFKKKSEHHFNHCVFQLTIEVADGGNPPKRTTAMLRILVDRNYHRPVWESLEYYKIIPENLPVMASVMQVRSLDNDTMVSVKMINPL